MIKLNAALGQRLRYLRRMRGLSQEGLGELAGLHNTYIGAIERGERSPSLETIETIAQSLGVKVSQLFQCIDEDSGSEIERARNELFALLEGVDPKGMSFLLDLVKNGLLCLQHYQG